MDDATRRAHRALDEAKAWKPPEGPIVLSDEYLRLVDRAADLPQNRPGSDKTWTERVLIEWKRALETVREIPRE